MIEPSLSGAAFLEDVAGVANSNGITLWWLGQSGFLLHWQGHFALLDPYLSDSLTLKYAKTDKPHVRMTARVIGPESLSFVQVVTATHQHTDHLDADTLNPLRQANPNLALVIPEALREFTAQRLNASVEWPIGLDAGQSAVAPPFQFHAVPAAHEQMDRDARRLHLYLGYIVEAGPWRIYHSGDTVRYPGMDSMLRPWRIDVALLPINGRAPERRVAGNLTGPEAAQLAHDIGAKLVIPCHYEMFEFNTAPPEAFVQMAQSLRQPFAVLKAGERLTLG